jgi:hypothetical protein
VISVLHDRWRDVGTRAAASSPRRQFRFLESHLSSPNGWGELHEN